jgi:hypothetical protein
MPDDEERPQWWRPQSFATAGRGLANQTSTPKGESRLPLRHNWWFSERYMKGREQQ